MKRWALTILPVILLLFSTSSPLRHSAVAAGKAWAKTVGQAQAKGDEAHVAPVAAPRQGADDAAALELKRQQLAEKEAELRAKEEELKKLSAILDKRINDINEARKAMEATLQVKKKQQSERYTKMIKVYKGLKPEEAGKLMDKLDERLVIEMLNQMDQKTAVKLIPFMNQPRVLKWTSENLAGK